MNGRKHDDDEASPDDATTGPNGPTDDLFSLGNRAALRALLEQAARAREDAARAVAAARDRKRRKPRR